MSTTNPVQRFRPPFPVEVVLALATGVAAFALSAVVCSAARGHIPEPLLGLGLLAATLVIARFAGILYALPAGVTFILAFDWYFLPPLRIFSEATVLVLGLFIVMAVIVGAVSKITGRRALAAERARGDLAETQASLRRLALLIAQGEPPESVLAAVTREVLRHVGTGTARLIRFDSGGAVTIIAEEATAGPQAWTGGPRSDELVAAVRRTGHTARFDHQAIGVPISVSGRLWGMFLLGSGERLLSADAEPRMAEFIELVATAVADAQHRAELKSSRARIVSAADEARRRIERDLHDGAQQRLVALALRLRTASIDAGRRGERHQEVADAADDLLSVIDELRELSRGIHPAVLSDSGLRPALRALGRRSPLPVEVTVRVDGRLPQEVEVGAYYVVSEMLTNAVKHAGASVAEVRAEATGDALELRVRDNGAGGADPARGSGLVGLKDRVEALGGTFDLDSPPGGGTTVICRIPVATPLTAKRP